MKKSNTKKYYLVVSITLFLFIYPFGDKLSGEELAYGHLIVPKIDGKSYGVSPRDESKFQELAGLKNLNFEGNPVPFELRISPPEIDTNKEPSLTSGTKLATLEKTTPINPFLDIKLYQLTGFDGSGYFKIAITTNSDADCFNTFDRDILFLIDASASIVDDQLSEFVKGIASSIPKLKPTDRFEIVAFRNEPLALFGKMQVYSKANIEKALLFLNDLRQSGATNLYNALSPYVSSKYKADGRSLLIFMLSDGELNSGEIVDNRDFISSISNKNYQTASIFTFTNAKKSNTFLLELLAYRNRGAFIKAETTDGSSEVLKRSIDSASRIILKDLDYQISSDLSAKTFPKRLPNLYRDRPINLLGRYWAGMNKVSLRITGTGKGGEKYELIYSESLDNATKSGGNLAKQWAQQYIYHLYSGLTAHYSEHAEQKIYSLARKYSVPNLYFKEPLFY